jgi:hypothetical protein
MLQYTLTLSCHHVMNENHINLTIVKTETRILTHVIEHDKNRLKRHHCCMDFKVLVSINHGIL